MLESLETRRESEKKILEQQNEFKKLQTIFEKDRDSMNIIKAQLDEQNKIISKMKAEQESLTEEKNKFQDYKNKEKERLLEIQKKLQEKSE